MNAALLSRYLIDAVCPACRRHALLDGSTLAAHMGPSDSLETLLRRFRCSRCHRLGPPDIRIIHAAPDPFEISARQAVGAAVAVTTVSDDTPSAS